MGERNPSDVVFGHVESGKLVRLRVQTEKLLLVFVQRREVDLSVARVPREVFDARIEGLRERRYGLVAHV